MDLNVYVGKNYDEILEKALEELKLTKEDVVVSKKEVKKGLFKGTELELTITPLKDILEYVKNYLSEVLSKMGIDASYESQIRDKQLKLKIVVNFLEFIFLEKNIPEMLEELI